MVALREGKSRCCSLLIIILPQPTVTLSCLCCQGHQVLRLRGGCGSGEDDEENIDEESATCEDPHGVEVGSTKLCKDILVDIIEDITEADGGEVIEEGEEDNSLGEVIEQGEEDNSLSASFKMFCFNEYENNGTCLPIYSPLLIAGQTEYSHETKIVKRPGIWHFHEIDKKNERPGPGVPPRKPDIAFGNMTVEVIEEEDGINIGSLTKESYRRSEAQLDDLQLAREDQRRVGGGIYQSKAQGMEQVFLHIKKGASDKIGISLVECKGKKKVKQLSHSFAKMNYESYTVQSGKRFRKSYPEETDTLGYFWLGFGGDLPFPDNPAREFYIFCEMVERDMHFPVGLCDRKQEAPGASQFLCNNRSCGIIIWHLSKKIFIKSRDGDFSEKAQEHFAMVTFKNGQRRLLWTDRYGHRTWWERLQNSPDQETFSISPSSFKRVDDIMKRGTIKLEYFPAPQYLPASTRWEDMQTIRRLQSTSPW